MSANQSHDMESPTEMDWISDLEDRAWFRMVFAFGIAVFMATLFAPDQLDLTPSPLLPIRVLRLTSISLVAYLVITGVVDLLFLYIKGLSFCSAMAHQNEWARHLPALYKHLMIRFLRTVIKRMNVKRTIWFSFNCCILFTGLWFQRLAQEILKA